MLIVVVVTRSTLLPPVFHTVLVADGDRIGEPATEIASGPAFPGDH